MYERNVSDADLSFNKELWANAHRNVPLLTQRLNLYSILKDNVKKDKPSR